MRMDKITARKNDNGIFFIECSTKKDEDIILQQLNTVTNCMCCGKDVVRVLQHGFSGHDNKCPHIKDQ